MFYLKYTRYIILSVQEVCIFVISSMRFCLFVFSKIIAVECCLLVLSHWHETRENSYLHFIWASAGNVVIYWLELLTTIMISLACLLTRWMPACLVYMHTWWAYPRTSDTQAVLDSLFLSTSSYQGSAGTVITKHLPQSLPSCYKAQQ